MEDLGLSASVVIPPDAAEPAPLPGEAPDSYAVRAATAKAASLLPLITGPKTGGCVVSNAAPCPVHSSQPFHPAGAIIIAADTVVALEGRILGKPSHAGQALEFLRLLSGKTHEVITACALAGATFHESFAVRSMVHMWNAPEDLLAAYARSGEPLDKAGAYAVQGLGAVLVERVKGSWSNVVGLPLVELTQALLRIGAIAVKAPPA